MFKTSYVYSKCCNFRDVHIYDFLLRLCLNLKLKVTFHFLRTKRKLLKNIIHNFWCSEYTRIISGILLHNCVYKVASNTFDLKVQYFFRLSKCILKYKNNWKKLHPWDIFLENYQIRIFFPRSFTKHRTWTILSFR